MKNHVYPVPCIRPRYSDRLGERGRFPIYQKELESAIKRQKEIETYKEEIGKISETKQLDMMRRIQRLIPEVGVPLRHSADSLNISSSDHIDDNVIYLNRETIKTISDEKVDKTTTNLKGLIKSYDQENGYGKFRIQDSGSVMSFRVPFPSKSNSSIVLDVMLEDNVTLAFYVVRDSTGHPVRLIFDRIILAEDA